jgi:hypothetical protein
MPAFVSEAGGSRRVLLTAGSVAAVAVLAVGAAVGLRARGGSPHRPSAPSSSAPSPPAAAPPAGSATGVDVRQLSWISFHGVWLPTSTNDGPRVQHADLASGFAQTPTGALLAAMHIVVRADAQWGPLVFTPTIRDQVVGADAAALLTANQDYYSSESQAAGVKAGQPLGAAYVTEAGFRWQSYAPDAATLDLLSAGPGEGGNGTVQVATRVQLLWKSADWRVVAPPGGTWANSASQVTATSGFVLFPGQR